MRIRSKQFGFSLIEVMITIAIVAIIASIAYPSYQSHYRKVARSDGKTGLLEAAEMQERFFLENQAYTTDLTDLGYDATAESPQAYYTLVATSTNVNSNFTLTATVAKGTDADCNTITITSDGTKGGATAICW